MRSLAFIKKAAIKKSSLRKIASTAAIGPLLIIGSLAASWPAFSGAQGEDGNVAFGLWVGAASILLMSWSFVLALRPRVLEPIFGGLDRMYRAHRWAGAIAVVFMFLHTRAEPEIEGGIRGAAESVADTAEGLAGFGEMMLYVLVGLSLVRLFPYRWWRLTHKLLGIPFLFACWHFFTAEKPYANASAWGYWFGAWMVAGIVGYVARVGIRDAGVTSNRYEVTAAIHDSSTTQLRLRPTGAPVGQELGQFAFLKLDVPGMREPHAFTIASCPERDDLEFHIRHLGDWSDKLRDHDLVGATASIEGPYGAFEPLPSGGEKTLWIAGGVGVTPFLAAIDGIERGSIEVAERPTLFYASNDLPDSSLRRTVERAADRGLIELKLFTKDTGRMSESHIHEHFPSGLKGFHVALCGPNGLVSNMANACDRLGARKIETEDFDMRGGVGPELSRPIAEKESLVANRLNVGR